MHVTPPIAFAGLRAGRPAMARDQRAILVYFCAQIAGLTLLQKFGIPIAVALPIMLGGLAVLLAYGVAKISTARLLLYGLFCLSTAASQLFVGHGFSGGALLLLYSVYASIVFYLDVTRDTYLRLMKVFLNAMVALSIIVIYQAISQELVGISAWPNLNKLPAFLQVSPGFMYFRETAYMSGRFQPNGIFFLEPSIVSQFLALAVIIELVWFRTFWRLAAFASGMILTLAGSGLLILGLTAPFLAAKLPARALLAMFAALALTGGVATAVGWTEQMGKRVGEFATPGTSGYIRYTEPMLRVTAQLDKPKSIYTGDGAGSAVFGDGYNVLPVSKAITEYGLISAITFYVLFVFSLFWRTPSKRVAIGFLLYHSLGGGGLSVPVYALMCILFCAQLRIRSDQPSAAASS